MNAGDVLHDEINVDIRLCGPGFPLLKVGKCGCFDTPILKICARDTDVDLTIIDRDEGDLEIGLGAGSADALADHWDAESCWFGCRSLLAWLCHAMRVADAGLQTCGPSEKNSRPCSKSCAGIRQEDLTEPRMKTSVIGRPSQCVSMIFRSIGSRIAQCRGSESPRG